MVSQARPKSRRQPDLLRRWQALSRGGRLAVDRLRRPQLRQPECDRFVLVPREDRSVVDKTRVGRKRSLAAFAPARFRRCSLASIASTRRFTVRKFGIFNPLPLAPVAE